VDHVIAVDKVELSEGENAISVERRLELTGKRVDSGEFGHPQHHLHAPVSRSVNSSAN
jgi:hypothetical protein